MSRLQRPITARVVSVIKRYGQLSKEKILELTDIEQQKFELTSQGKLLADIRKGQDQLLDKPLINVEQ